MPTGSARDVAIVTPWYPTNKTPFGGSFVASMVDAVAPQCDRIQIFHTDGWGARYSVAEDARIWAAHLRTLSRTVAPGTSAAGHPLLYVPVPVRVGMSFAQLAVRHAAALRTALDGRPIDAPVVHAHVGLRGGYTALENARPDAKVYVVEHASFLEQVLAEPDSRALYDEVLGRVTKFFVVGETLRDTLVAAFPHHAGQIAIMPNPVAFDPPRTEPVRELRSWVCLGNLIPRKRGDLLLEAFAQCHAKDPSLELTYVGGGTLLTPLQRRAAELGLESVVHFPGPVAPDVALDLMRRHDLVVAVSRKETFGLTPVEAVAAGTPVLVTRCGGPEYTLAGVERDAGELIDVIETPESVAEGYWRLRDRFPDGLDLARARRVLEERFSYEAVGRAHATEWFGEAR